MVKWNFRNLFILISFTFSELEGIKVIIEKSCGEVSLIEQDHRSKDFEAMKAAICPKSQFLFHENIPPRDFFIMTLEGMYYNMLLFA